MKERMRDGINAQLLKVCHRMEHSSLQEPGAVAGDSPPTTQNDNSFGDFHITPI
jgi:hypothetical protein